MRSFSGDHILSVYKWSEPDYIQLSARSLFLEDEEMLDKKRAFLSTKVVLLRDGVTMWRYWRIWHISSVNDLHACMYTHTHTDEHKHRHTDTHKHRHTDTDTQTHRHRHTQTHTQTHTDKHRHTDTHRYTQTHTHTELLVPDSHCHHEYSCRKIWALKCRTG